MAKFDEIGCLPMELYSGKTEQFMVSPSMEALSISRCVVFSVIRSGVERDKRVLLLLGVEVLYDAPPHQVVVVYLLALQP